MEQLIRTSAELRNLLRRSARHGLRRVILNLPGDPSSLRKAEVVINRALQACGCEAAAAFLVVGMLAIAASFMRNPAPFSLGSTWSWLGIVGLLSTFSLAGKFLGLVVAEWRLRAAINRIAGKTYDYLSESCQKLKGASRDSAPP